MKKMIVLKNIKKKQVKTKLTLLRPIIFNSIDIDIEGTQSVFLRTAQTSASFSSTSQVHALNIANFVVSSNNYVKLLTAGIPNFEYCLIQGMEITWFPALITAVSGTFEPVAFDFRYFASKSFDSDLPSGYYGNYNDTNMSVLLQQTAKPIRRRIPFPAIPLLADTGFSVLGQMIDATMFTNSATNIGGILTIIQTQPSLNSIATYNPKLGFVEIKMKLRVYNSVV